MATNFPTSLDSYSTKVDGVDDVMAAHVNNLQDAVVAVETLLGIGSNITLGTAKWIGLGLSSGRIVFTNSATDTIVLMDCNVGIGKVPASPLDVEGDVRGLGIYNNSMIADITSSVTNTWYDAITLESASGSRPHVYIVWAKIINALEAGFYAIGIVFVFHSGTYLANCVNIANAYVEFQLKSTTANPPILQVRETVSGTSIIIRVGAVRLSRIGI